MTQHRIAINGFGRIGRLAFRAVHERQLQDHCQVIAVNDLVDAASLAPLLQRDSVHGAFDADVKADSTGLLVDGRHVKVPGLADPAALPWQELGIDLVLECSGRLTADGKAAAHLTAGAGKVLISAPAQGVDLTVVRGVNDDLIEPQHRLISNASCTTNCLATLLKPLQENIGIEHGLMCTVHAYTNDQNLHDSAHRDPRRARASALSMIPSSTGAAKAIGLVLPELEGKLDGYAIRVPTPNVSLVDVTLQCSRDTSAAEAEQILRDAAAGPLQGLLAVTDEPLVSIDFNHNPHSATFDPSLTQMSGKRLLRVCAWYDNEWGFVNRMLDIAQVMLADGPR